MNRTRSLNRYLGFQPTASNLLRTALLASGAATAGGSDYIPADDLGLQTWALNFSTQLTATPTDFGLVAGDATAYAALYATYAAAYTAATDPGTRTAATIAAKDTARDALVAKTRQLVGIVQTSTATDDADRALLGITIPDALPSTIPAPSTKPVLNIEDIQNLGHVIRLRDELTPTSNSKPDGSVGAEIWMAIGPTVPGSIADCDYVGLATTRMTTVTHDSGNRGKQAYYLARWINAKGERGPVADMIDATIAG